MIPCSAGFAALVAAFRAAGLRFAIGGSWASTAFGEPRFTNDVDILVDFTTAGLDVFLQSIPEGFYFDADEARRAVRAGRHFNLIHTASVFKFDLFPARVSVGLA